LEQAVEDGTDWVPPEVERATPEVPMFETFSETFLEH